MTDLISRADAIEAIMKHHDGGLNQINYGLTLAKNELQALPSADDGLRCALAGGRKCFAQGYDFTWCITCPHISEEDRQLVNHAVLAIPSADAEWIPCSERLPDEGQGVIVTVDDNVYKIKVGSCIYSNGRFHSLYNDLTVTAWMPLPKPYKGGDDE